MNAPDLESIPSSNNNLVRIPSGRSRSPHFSNKDNLGLKRRFNSLYYGLDWDCIVSVNSILNNKDMEKKKSWFYYINCATLLALFSFSCLTHS